MSTTLVASRLRRAVSGLAERPFLKHSLTLMSGTAAAQVVIFLATPVLSRLYDPVAFGAFGIFSGAVGLIGTSAALRYDMAIPLPKDEGEAQSLLLASSSVVAVSAAATGGVVLLMGSTLADAANITQIRWSIWLAPIWVFMFGMFQVLTFWASRCERYSSVSQARIERASGVATAQMGWGLLGSGSRGLIAGFVVGHGVGTLRLASMVRGIRWDAEARTLPALLRVMRRYRDFALLGAPSTLLNALGGFMPPLALGLLFSPAVAGAYWFTWRLLQVPTEVVGQSLRQVLIQHGAQAETGELRRLVWRSTAALAAVAAGPVLATVLFGPSLFTLVFGQAWTFAGGLARWISIAWMANLVSQPTLTMLTVQRRQHRVLAYEVTLTAARALALGGGLLLEDAGATVAAFSLVSACGAILMVLFHRSRSQNELASASAGTGWDGGYK